MFIENSHVKLECLSTFLYLSLLVQYSSPLSDTQNDIGKSISSVNPVNKWHCVKQFPIPTFTWYSAFGEQVFHGNSCL